MAAPKGFRKVETSLAGFWKPEKAGQCLRGVVGHAIEARSPTGETNTFYSIKLTDILGGPVVSRAGKTIKHAVGQQVGVGGKTLLTFLRENVGREVYLEYKGLGDAKKGQNAPKLYDCYVMETADDIPE